MTRPKNLREQMPKAAAWIDDLRAAFGKEGIDEQIRKGVREGVPVFWARENGCEVGTRYEHSGTEVSVATMVVIRKEEHAVRNNR